MSKKKKIVKLLSLALIVDEADQLEQQEKEPRKWVRDWVSRRKEEVPLYTEVQSEDREKFFADFRLYPDEFENLLKRIGPKIQKQDTHMRDAISSRVRLQATLRFLSGPASFPVLEDIFRIPKPTLSRMIPEVCEALWEELNEECIVLPQDSASWLAKSAEFEMKWQYPFALAALDGKHVEVQAFQDSGSSFFNYKGHFSIVLFALVDANYNFLFVDIGQPGSLNDARVWQESRLKKALDTGALHLPVSNTGISYHFLGDEIFPLTTSLMKPFARTGNLGNTEKIFNYRLSRARRVVENAFGILASRFRVLRSPILQKYENAVKTVKAAVVLHNYIIKHHSFNNYANYSNLRRENESGEISPGFWELEGEIKNLSALGMLAGNRSGTAAARAQRDKIAKEFMVDNRVPWQFNSALRSQ